MNITVLTGSPHVNGSSNLLAKQFIKGAEEAGHQIKVLDVAHMSVHPCIACDHCHTAGSCVFQDDNQKIQKNLLKTDMIVFVSPIYYYMISAQLKAVIDRFYGYNDEMRERHIKAALITASDDDNDDAMPYVEHYFGKLCRYMNFTNCGSVLGTGCGIPEKTALSEHMKEAYQFGQAL